MDFQKFKVSDCLDNATNVLSSYIYTPVYIELQVITYVHIYVYLFLLNFLGNFKHLIFIIPHLHFPIKSIC